MKTSKYGLIILAFFLLLLFSWIYFFREFQPQLYSIVNKNISLNKMDLELVELENIDSNSINFINNGSSQNFNFKITFKPFFTNQEITFGEINSNTKFQQVNIHNKDYWIPQAFEVKGMADSSKVKMEVTPSYRILFLPDSSLSIYQKLKITVQDINAYSFSKTIEREDGTISVSGVSGGGASSIQTIRHYFECKNGQLTLKESSDSKFGFDKEWGSNILGQVFGAKQSVIGEYNLELKELE